MSWETLYDLLGIKDFIYFICSPEIQEMLLPVKVVFIACGFFFLGCVIYFWINSSWLKFHFLQDVIEFFSWRSFGAIQIENRWKKIIKKTESGLEVDYKLAIIEAEDFLTELLEDAGYEGKNFEESIKKAERLLGPLSKELLKAHETRNAIVYSPDFKLTPEIAQKTLEIYKSAVNTIGA